ncbi:MAG: helix-turn-helix domain-containing protein [Oscillibacter sp.]|nr:helix-turn-helix domain-containing protein [Oscillibacter sp.]
MAIAVKRTEELPIVLTPSDIAAILGVSRNTSYEVLHSENFPAFKVGKLYRVPRDEFLLWMESQTANKTLN